METKVIATNAAPGAIGPYSQAVRAGGTVYCSGQLGLDPATGKLAEGVRAQAERSLANLKAVLEAAGLGMRDVVKTTIFLADMADFAAVNEVYAAAFASAAGAAGPAYPARSTVQVAGLPKGASVEIEAIAAG